MSNILCSIENAENSQDDIIVWGKDVHSHNETLKNVFEKIRSHGLKLNKSECQIVFLGHAISRDGIKADPKKVHAISNLPQPNNKTEWQKFFGMLHYFGKFIPNLSIKSANLRKLLEKDNEFIFDTPQIDAFNKLKKLVANMPTLKFFDINLPIKITCDGLGAMLEQLHGTVWYPTAFTSRSLTTNHHHEYKIFCYNYKATTFNSTMSLEINYLLQTSSAGYRCPTAHPRSKATR